jgi:hypothetical protein
LAEDPRIATVRDNVRRFERDLVANLERATSLITQSTYWVFDGEEAGFGPGKFVGYPGLPIWEDENATLLSNLAVARARGGMVFTLQPEHWNAIVRLVRGVSPTDGPAATLPTGGQGIGLNRENS